MIQIGSDGGYINKPQELYYFVIYPGERFDLLIDFSGYEENDKIIMKNLFSTDECEDIMEFIFTNINKKIEHYLPKTFTKYPHMKINTSKLSTILLQRKDGYFINNKAYLSPPDIVIKVGSIFIWEFINLCDDDIYQGSPILPELYETGFKDTLYCPPSFSTGIIIRYTPTYIMEDVKLGENYFSFNTSDGPEYIINSRILEQKDNYLVRPQIIYCEE